MQYMFLIVINCYSECCSTILMILISLTIGLSRCRDIAEMFTIINHFCHFLSFVNIINDWTFLLLCTDNNFSRNFIGNNIITSNTYQCFVASGFSPLRHDCESAECYFDKRKKRETQKKEDTSHLDFAHERREYFLVVSK